MAIFGAQGIRDAVLKSYQKHIHKFERESLPEGTTLHQMGLYGCLATRYMAGFQSKSEVELWSELLPFVRLKADDGLAALAEYIVYKEMPPEADVTALTERLRDGLSLLAKEEREMAMVAAQVNAFAWVGLI
jgi:hypothetical protein